MSPESFVADVLLPLRQARRRRGLAWLALAPDPSVASYFEAPQSRTGGVARVPIDAVDAAAMLEALAAWWTADAEGQLASILPDLEDLRETVTAQMQPAGTSVPKLSYTAYPLL